MSTLDANRTLRRDTSRPVRRTPTTAMREALFHVGAVSWANPWEITEAGPLFRWVVARHSVLRGATTFVEGSGRVTRPEALVADDVLCVVGADAELSWVGVSANRLSLFRQIEAAELSVTCGGEHNQALTAAIALMRQRIGASTREPTSAQAAMMPRAAPVKARERTPRSQLWMPSVSITVPGKSGSIIACDGSFDHDTKLGAYAAISTNGGMRAATDQSKCCGDAELMALLAGLELGIESGGDWFCLVSDSLVAIERLEAMLVSWRPLEQITIRASLHRKRQQLRSDVMVHHVRARTGDALHDSADALAFAVRRASTAPQQEIEEPLSRFVEELAGAVQSLPKTTVPPLSLKRLVITAEMAG
jgi:ribonuclease HI